MTRNDKNTHLPQTYSPFTIVGNALRWLRRGPTILAMRWNDQLSRFITGAPIWSMSEITPHIYIGGQQYPRGWDAMLEHGITAVINMREEQYDDAAMGVQGQRYLHLPTIDLTPPRIVDLNRGADFIAQEVERDGKVYIHCGVGMGRAPAQAAAYFIKHENLTPQHALEKIMQPRPFINLTKEQEQRLEEYARHLNAHES
ncbi:dual specificity protein phosphatase family protein [Chloroflexota bacterium]